MQFELFVIRKKKGEAAGAKESWKNTWFDDLSWRGAHDEYALVQVLDVGREAAQCFESKQSRAASAARALREATDCKLTATAAVTIKATGLFHATGTRTSTGASAGADTVTARNSCAGRPRPA
jgi:hypothetical protein